MRRRALVSLPLFGALTACAYRPPASAPQLTMPSQWLTPGGDAALSPSWWRAFGDSQLSALVEEALQRNLDVRQASARLEEARSMASAARGAELPSLDAGVGVARSRSISDVTLKPYLSTGHRAEFQAAYEIDIWGRASAATAAAEAGADAATYARDAVALSVAATVATAYLTLRAIDAQLDLAHQTLASRRASFDIMAARERQGFASNLESRQAEAEWRATAELIPQLEAATSRQERVIDTLLARLPTRVDRGLALLDIVPPPMPDSGLPSLLLQRRPDIASAERQVIAADAQLYAARARLLPAVRLTGMLGSAGASVLRGDPFTVWEAGGSVLAPIFHGGSLRALASASASRRDQAVLAYERVVLTSIAEVETQLATLLARRQQRTLAVEHRAAVAETVDIASQRAANGYAAFIDRLLAERTLLAADSNLLNLHADLLASQIGVFRALGGGWDSSGVAGNSPSRG